MSRVQRPGCEQSAYELGIKEGLRFRVQVQGHDPNDAESNGKEHGT